jgi:phosphoglycolate phosphatase
MRGMVVFDLDGTLAETAPDIMATLNRILVKEGLAALPLEKARELVGAGARALIDRGFKASGAPLSPEKLDLLFQDFLVDYIENIHHATYLYPGVEAALDALEAQGYAFAVCTNKPEPHSVKLIESLGIAKRFRFIAGRETFPFNKPDPRHLTETIRLAGGNAGRAIMVGDSKTDVDTARAARIPVIGFTFGYTDVPMASLKPDIVLDHFDGLVEAVAQFVR